MSGSEVYNWQKLLKTTPEIFEVWNWKILPSQTHWKVYSAAYNKISFLYIYVFYNIVHTMYFISCNILILMNTYNNIHFYTSTTTITKNSIQQKLAITQEQRVYNSKSVWRQSCLDHAFYRVPSSDTFSEYTNEQLVAVLVFVAF